MDHLWKHGHARKSGHSPTYGAYRNMISSCEYEGHSQFELREFYKVRVCSKWRQSFPAFLKDMGERPSEKHVLCLLDQTRNYEKRNCAWLTRSELNRFFHSNVCAFTLTELSEALGIKLGKLMYQLHRERIRERYRERRLKRLARYALGNFQGGDATVDGFRDVPLQGPPLRWTQYKRNNPRYRSSAKENPGSRPG
ncbi:MAG TPA: hypothetical protein VHT68_05315 [Pseudolabrys sp.]|nr:hypothetical protein [Pseudolabrys sp.]